MLLFVILTDMDECVLNVHSCNPLISTCQNTVGSYSCFCKRGFPLKVGNACEGNAIIMRLLCNMHIGHFLTSGNQTSRVLCNII